jgi:hypothetical protein
MMLGFVGTLFVTCYIWTAIGVLTAASLVVAALHKGKDDAGHAR